MKNIKQKLTPLHNKSVPYLIHYWCPFLTRLLSSGISKIFPKENFKSRYASHKSSFTHERYSNSTTLSAYIWKLKAEGKEFNTRWSIASYAKPYHPLARRCHLCIKEKTLIARNIDDPKCLNLRSELLGKCRHKARWLLSSDVG